VNDLEFCENLNTVEAQLEGGQTNLVIKSPLLAQDLSFQITRSPFNGAISKLLIGLFGTDTVLAVNKPKFMLGFQFIVPKQSA
jgi:hypothetical protein